MEEQLQSKEVIPKSDAERFNELFSGGAIKEIAVEDVPPVIVEKFESWAQKYILPKDYLPNNFISTYLLEHENGDRTYIAELVRNYAQDIETRKSVVFTEAYFVEMRGDVEIGHGEIRRDVSEQPVHGGNPYIGYTSTEEEYRRGRLGERRLNTMNAFAQAKYGTQLFSGTTITDKARAMFEKLAEEGKVEVVDDPMGNQPRSYRMPKMVTAKNGE